MSYLIENFDEHITGLSESVVFLVNLLDEIETDTELLNEAILHIRSLARLHALIKEEAQAV